MGTTKHCNDAYPAEAPARGAKLPLIACAVVAVAAGCKQKDAPKPPPPIASDAATAPDAEAALPDEDALRAGKRTGLGGPDEQPEIATEDFARALITGTTPWSRVVSPTSGVVELRFAETPNGSFLGRRCGKEVDAALGALGAAMVAQLARADHGYELTCDNSGLIATPVKSALCSIDGTAEDSIGYDLVFVPDPTLGLRLVGFTIVDGGAAIDQPMDAFDLELARTGKLCP